MTTDREGVNRAVTWKRALRVAGVLFFLVSLVYLAREVMNYHEALGATFLRPGILASIVLGAIAYAGLLFLLARVWTRLASRAVEPEDRGAFLGASGRHAYALSGVFKYLPGNVFHLVSRQAFFRHAGASQLHLARTSLTELLVQLAAAAGVALLIFTGSCLGHSCTGLALAGLRVPPWGIVLGLLALALVALGVAGRQFPLHALRRPLLLSLAFFLGFAVILALLFALLRGSPPLLTDRLVAAYLVAWIVGFITPGAPGGLGVREAVFIALAGVSGPLPVEGALLGRLVSTLGDVLFPAMTFFPARRQDSSVTRQGKADP
jgi:uncharacterized membrane protein YbhN (UPF0104 family)